MSRRVYASRGPRGQTRESARAEQQQALEARRQRLRRTLQQRNPVAYARNNPPPLPPAPAPAAPVAVHGNVLPGLANHPLVARYNAPPPPPPAAVAGPALPPVNLLQAISHHPLAARLNPPPPPPLGPVPLPAPPQPTLQAALGTAYANRHPIIPPLAIPGGRAGWANPIKNDPERRQRLNHGPLSAPKTGTTNHKSASVNLKALAHEVARIEAVRPNDGTRALRAAVNTATASGSPDLETQLFNMPAELQQGPDRNLVDDAEADYDPSYELNAPGVTAGNPLPLTPRSQRFRAVDQRIQPLRTGEHLDESDLHDIATQISSAHAHHVRLNQALGRGPKQLSPAHDVTSGHFVYDPTLGKLVKKTTK